MSELRAFDIVVAEEGYCEGIVKYRRAVYDKSEADKVIAELIEKNKRLAHKDLIMASETIKDVLKELRHQKYKRCLAMAEKCEERYYYLNSLEYYQLTDREYRQVIGGYWDRWLKRWLELAEKFKEAK